MELKKALRILDPATREEALAVYGGDCAMRAAAIEEACRVVCTWVRERMEAEKNEPLTLAELLEMNERPVWDNYSKEWGIVTVDTTNNQGMVKYFDRSSPPLFDRYFYRRPPETEVST